jgi:chromosome segregation ATPase
VEPAERQHAEEIRVLQHQRETLQRKLAGLATREEELRGKAARAVELDQERQALEELLEEASADISSRDEELSTLQSSLKRASKASRPKGREGDQLGKRLRALYPTIEVDEKALHDLIALRDEVMKLKAEQAIKRLDGEADNVAVRRKVGGLPNHLSIFELGFAGKGRIYYMRGRQRRFRLLAVGAKNSQNQDMDYLSRLPREE